MQIVEIKPRVFACLLANETANAGFAVTDLGTVVIDSLNTPARGRGLAQAIRQRIPKPFLFVINTHHHYDHIFGNQAFSVPVVGHCALSSLLAQAADRDLMPLAVAARLSEHPEDQWLIDELELTYPNVIFERRLVLHLPPLCLRLEHMGGHTPDSAIVDLPDEGVLFTGDLVFEGRVPYLGQANIGETIGALRRLEQLGERTIVPGHGAICDMAYVTRLRDYVESLHQQIGEMLTQGMGKGEILDSDRLPEWWTEDRPELLRLNIARVYDELARD
jgi:glyoxylase-like metal-dependent hydrolase (beta-lactamase superfamily II)